MNIHFEILKLKKDLQLEIPFGSTFSFISEMVFKCFGLDKKDYPDDIKSRLKFIYNQIYCRDERTIESYNITSQSKIYISIPKFLINKFSEAKTIEIERNSDKTIEIERLKKNSIEIVRNQFEVDIPLPFSLDKNQLPPVNEEIAYANILRSLSPIQLQQIIECGYDQKSAAYALIYFQDIQDAFDFLVLKIPDDPEYRYLINQIYMKRMNMSTLYKYDLMLSFLISKYTKENPYVRAAVCIHFYLILISDAMIRYKLTEFYNKVNQRYPGQIQIMLNQYMVKQKRPMIFYRVDFNNQGKENLNDISEKFQNILMTLENATPDNYRNPFIETYNDYQAICPNAALLKLLDYGKTMNFDQLKFVYQKCAIEHKRLNHVVELMMVCQGDLDATQNLLYSS